MTLRSQVFWLANVQNLAIRLITQSNNTYVIFVASTWSLHLADWTIDGDHGLYVRIVCPGSQDPLHTRGVPSGRITISLLLEWTRTTYGRSRFWHQVSWPPKPCSLHFEIEYLLGKRSPSALVTSLLIWSGSVPQDPLPLLHSSFARTGSTSQVSPEAAFNLDQRLRVEETASGISAECRDAALGNSRGSAPE